MIKILHTLMEAANAGLADAVRKKQKRFLAFSAKPMAMQTADMLLSATVFRMPSST